MLKRRFKKDGRIRKESTYMVPTNRQGKATGKIWFVLANILTILKSLSHSTSKWKIDARQHSRHKPQPD